MISEVEDTRNAPKKAGRKKGAPKTGCRKKGTPNKNTALLKDAILQAAERAGDEAGMVGYLEAQARENPGPFLSLLGKVLPMQVNADVTGITIKLPKGSREA